MPQTAGLVAYSIAMKQAEHAVHPCSATAGRQVAAVGGRRRPAHRLSGPAPARFVGDFCQVSGKSDIWRDDMRRQAATGAPDQEFQECYSEYVVPPRGSRPLGVVFGLPVGFRGSRGPPGPWNTSFNRPVFIEEQHRQMPSPSPKPACVQCNAPPTRPSDKQGCPTRSWTSPKCRRLGTT